MTAIWTWPDQNPQSVIIFPVHLSLVIAIKSSCISFSNASPHSCLLTCSQLLAWWHRAILVLNDMVGSEERCVQLIGFWPQPLVGGVRARDYVPISDLMTLVGLTMMDYVCGQTPAFAQPSLLLENGFLHLKSFPYLMCACSL